MSPLPDADDGDLILDAFARAQNVLGVDPGPDTALAECVEAWASEMGLDVEFSRELVPGAGLLWHVWIHTGRGSAKHRPDDGETWRALLGRLDLLPPHAPRT